MIQFNLNRNKIKRTISRSTLLKEKNILARQTPPTPPNIIQKKRIIPLNLFQTWHTLQLPFYMKKTVELLKKLNPEFRHYLFDDFMCRAFIKDNFDKEILHTFDKLKPGAYKADLWRYCVLYKLGGIYLDIKFQMCNSFKLIYLTDAEYFVRDRAIGGSGPGIYQAVMCCLPKNKALYQCIRDIVDYVKYNSYKFHNALSVTGPQLIKKYINHKNCFLFFENDGRHVTDARLNLAILKPYSFYRQEQKQYQTLPHYSILFNHNSIYNYVCLSYIKKQYINQKSLNVYGYKPIPYKNKNNVKYAYDSYTTLHSCEINKQLWLLCYKKQYNTIKNVFKWQHYFIIHDSDMTICKCSELFQFELCGSETCLDFCYKDETLLFKFNAPNKKVCVAKCSIQWVLDNLMWYTN